MQHEAEALVLCRYLTGESPGTSIIERYSAAVSTAATPLTIQQQKTWNRCMQHPRLLPYVDAAWAWKDPMHPLRHRIYIMLATLESHRSFQRYFLPAARNKGYTLFITLRLIGAGFRLMAGKAIVWFL